ncbi:hypothetical protein Leryth_027282, partial [Lithospermum erythrorhizon]
FQPLFSLSVQRSTEVSERQRAQIEVMKQWDPGIPRGLNVDFFQGDQC